VSGLCILLIRQILHIFRNRQTLEKSAVDIENKLHMHDQIISVVQMADGQQYSSDFLMQSLIEDTIRRFRKVRISSLFSYKEITRIAVWIVSILIVLSVTAGIAQSRLRLHAARFINPCDMRMAAKNLPFSVEPGNISVLEGSDVIVTFLIEGGTPRNLHIQYQLAGQTLEDPLTFVGTTNIKTVSSSNATVLSLVPAQVYRFYFDDVTTDFKYSILFQHPKTHANVETDRYSVSVVSRPLLSKITVQYMYPPYLHIPNYSAEGNGNIEAVIGTRVIIRGECNNQLDRALMVFTKAGNSVPLTIHGRRFSTALTVRGADSYYFRLRDNNGNTNTTPVTYSIIPVPDNFPSVRLEAPGRDILLPEGQHVPLIIVARDDFAINGLSIVYAVKRAFVPDLNVSGVRKKLAVQPQRVVRQEFTWDIEHEITLTPGDRIEYYIEADDGARIPEAHIVHTPTYVIKYPSMMEILHMLNKREYEQVNKLEELLQEQKKLSEATEKLTEKIDTEKELNYIDRRKLENLAAQQADLQQEMATLQKDIHETLAQAQKNNMAAPEIVKKMQQIQELMNELLSEEMKNAMKQLQKAAEQMMLNKTQENMKTAQYNQKEFIEKLDRTIQQLKYTQHQRQLDSLIDQLDTLQEEHNQLEQETREAEQNPKTADKKLAELQKKAEQNARETEKFEEALRELSEKMKETNPDAASDLKKAAHIAQQEKLQEHMQQFSQNMSQKNMSACRSQGKKVQETMQRISRMMKDTREMMQGKTMEKIQQELNEIIFVLGGIGVVQEAVADGARERCGIDDPDVDRPFEGRLDFKGGDAFSTHSMAEQELDIARKVAALKNKLIDDMRGAVMLDETLYSMFDTIAEQCTASAEYINTGDFQSAYSLSRVGLGSINKATLMLLESSEQIRQQSKAMAGNNMMDMLNSLAEAQKQLNKKTKRAQGQCNKPGGASPQLQQYLQELAHQQQMIQDALQQMHDMYGNQMDKMMGQLGNLAGEMEEIKKQLEEYNVDERLLNKQDKVLERMLDSQRSLQSKGRKKKRQAETAEQTHYETDIQDIDPAVIKQKQEEHDFGVPSSQKYPEQYRALVEEYFKSLSLQKKATRGEQE